MWKEIYRLGVDKIDRQHMELFEMTEDLIETVKSPDFEKRKKQCKEAILFLKNYSIEHFADEEEYQREKKYAGFTAHRQLHQDFISSVLEHEGRMVSSDFDMQDVKCFIGMLTAWLAYHVADADQKIVTDINPVKTVIECLYTAICHTLNVMANIRKKDIIKNVIEDDAKGDISVTTVLTGDVSITIEYEFTNEFALKLLKAFLLITPESMDAIVYSILLEIVNTITKNTVLELEKANVYCQPSTPVMKMKQPLSSAKECFTLNAPLGDLRVRVY